ncbi:polar amino acid transport system permease protein [Paenibacillus aquistagni]|uniref:Polar amino acid transport system permease protein n=1 Tax=Paenibacillus aquistagni TaxID=1852522 RepID=A0A1X7J9R7_9BACL|nr:polar amino acid transport system permease protein [Paenibacillus aquistagni]
MFTTIRQEMERELIFVNVFETIIEYKSGYLSGVGTTVSLSLLGVLVGVILGIVLVLMRISSIKPLRWISVTYIEVFRGTPLLVQLFIVYFGLSEYGISTSMFGAGLIAVSMNSAAYLAEIFRAGIQGVDRGQAEAARSLGMGRAMTFRHIVMPQAFRSVLPAIGNEFVTIIKETSIVSVIGLADLMFETNIIRSKTYTALAPLLGAAFFYFIMTFTLSKGIVALERKLNKDDRN